MSGSGGERRRPLANTGLRFSPVEHEGNATTLGKWDAFIAELIGEILDTETTRIDVSAGERPIAVGLSWSSRSKRSADGGVDGRVYSPLPSPRASKHGDRGQGRRKPVHTPSQSLEGRSGLRYGALWSASSSWSRRGRQKARNFARFTADAGTLEILGIEYPKMQLHTVGEILEGQRFKTPTVAGRHELEPRLPGIPVVGA